MEKEFRSGSGKAQDPSPQARTSTAVGRPRLVDRWPTALALVFVVGSLLLIVRLDREVELFGPLVVMMAGIYMMAYAIGRPWTAWISLVVLGGVMSVLQVLDLTEVLPVDPTVGMPIVVVLLWLWAVARRRYTDGRLFARQTAGMVGFGAVTLVCTAVAPQVGIALIGAGFLAHAIWDVYHFRANQVVNRPYAEYCGVIDFIVGPALIVAAFL